MTVLVVPDVRRRAVWDVVLSVLFLIGTVIAYFGGALMSVFLMAFTDYCPPGCDVDAGVGRVFAVGAVITFCVLAAIAGTVVLQVRRRRSWWVGLAAGILVVGLWIVAFTLYTDAVSVP